MAWKPARIVESQTNKSNWPCLVELEPGVRRSNRSDRPFFTRRPEPRMSGGESRRFRTGKRIMRLRAAVLRRLAYFGVGLGLLSGCQGFYIGSDALVQHLPPGRDQVCRAAVQDALAEKNVSEDWIRRVHYQPVRAGNRVRGFEAWVYPKEGGGALVVELTDECRVTQIWARGTR